MPKVDRFEGRTWLGREVPLQLRDGILRYVDHGIRPGHFLCAVISNDLREACAGGDSQCLDGLNAVVGWFYMEAPGECWGSAERLNAWIKKHAEVHDG